MTVSQNRFGGNSAVGRAYEKDYRNRGELAGVGLVGAGYGAKQHSNTVFAARNAKDVERSNKKVVLYEDIKRLKSAHASHRQASAADEKFARWLPGADLPGAKRFQADIGPLRYVVAPGNKEARRRVGEEISGTRQGMSRNKRILSESVRNQSRDVRSLGREITSLGRRAKLLRHGGIAGMGLGAATVAGSVYANEKSRGTLRYQRQNNGV